MLKFILVLLFMIPLFFLMAYIDGCLSLYFFMVFVFMMMINLIGGTENLGYMWGFDLLSYGLVLLSVWICGLMIMESVSVYRSSYFSDLFIFMVLFLY